MGGGSTQTIEQTFNLEVVNETVFEQITKNTNTIATAMNNIQEMDIEFGVIDSGCKATIGQTIDANSTTIGQLDSTTLGESKAAIETELQASAQAALEKVTEAGNFQFGDNQNIDQDVNLAVKNVINNVFTTENLNEVYAEVVNIQEGKLKVGVCNGEINFDQNIIAVLTAQAITKSISTAIAENELLSSLHASASAEAKTENKGLADIISKIGEILAGPLKYAIIASVVCCCMLVVLLVVMGLSPAGQSATKNLGSAGASRLGGRRF
jgi:hypothetical protein